LPIYEYECPACHEKYELRRSLIDNDSDVSCPKCGVKNQRRLFSLVAKSNTGGCRPGVPT